LKLFTSATEEYQESFELLSSTRRAEEVGLLDVVNGSISSIVVGVLRTMQEVVSSFAEALELGTQGFVYTDIKLIGSGVASQVFKARHKMTGQWVAIKKQLDNSRSRKEVELLQRLTVIGNPHTCKIISWFCHNEHSFVVMPLYTPFPKSGDKISEKRMLRILKGCLFGLDQLHILNFAHFDIKPENIMFEGDHAVLMDFGEACKFSAIKGTNVTAPEAKMDIYLLGTMFKSLISKYHYCDGKITSEFQDILTDMSQVSARSRSPISRLLERIKLIE
jgi:serine/threonine protein kinase